MAFGESQKLTHISTQQPMMSDPYHGLKTQQDRWALLSPFTGEKEAQPAGSDPRGQRAISTAVWRKVLRLKCLVLGCQDIEDRIVPTLEPVEKTSQERVN